MPNGNKKATVHAAKKMIDVMSCINVYRVILSGMDKCLQGHFIRYGSLAGKDVALDANGTEIDPRIRHILL